MENRRREDRKFGDATNPVCLDILDPFNGYVGQGQVMDVSARGIRIRIPYCPSIRSMIMLTPNIMFYASLLNGAIVSVKWSAEVIVDDKRSYFEVGCETKEDDVNLEEYIKQFRLN